MEAKREGGPVGKTADPQLVEAATRFVSEVIEKAKEEAGGKRAQQKREAGARAGPDGGDGGGGEAGARKARTFIAGGAVPGGAIPWHSRARGLLTRLLSSLCFRGSSATARSDIPKSS